MGQNLGGAVGQEIQPQVLPTATPMVRPPGAKQSDLSTPTTDRFGNLSLRVADVKYQIPLTRLPPGPYLLTFEAAPGEAVIRRDVRLSVK